MNNNLEQEARTEAEIHVREVTSVQASWTERERGEPGALTIQLVLDEGADEYVLRPTPDDAQVLVELFRRSGRATFDVTRRVLIFANLPLD